MHSRISWGLLCSVTLMAVPPTAQAASDDYPNKPIRLIVPFVPGAGTDITGRTVAAKLSERWSQQVVVDNRTGAAAPSASNSLRRRRPTATRSV
jgi:tripartite-type tricarboxylate transporter receptor subunit TctC